MKNILGQVKEELGLRQEDIIVEVGDLFSAVIATPAYLYVGKLSLWGGGALSLNRYEWKYIIAATAKPDGPRWMYWSKTALRIVFDKPVQDAAKEAARGGVVGGVVGAMIGGTAGARAGAAGGAFVGGAMGNGNEINLTFRANDLSYRGTKIARLRVEHFAKVCVSIRDGRDLSSLQASFEEQLRAIPPERTIWKKLAKVCLWIIGVFVAIVIVASFFANQEASK